MKLVFNETDSFSCLKKIAPATLHSLAHGQITIISIAGSTIHASACKGHWNRRFNGCRSKSQAHRPSMPTNSNHKTAQEQTSTWTGGVSWMQSQMTVGLVRADGLGESCRWRLPASHSVASVWEEPWGQAQVYPPGRRRHRWLHTFLQGLGTMDDREYSRCFRTNV